MTTHHLNLYSDGSEYHSNDDICIIIMTYICIIQIFPFNWRMFCYILALKLLCMFLNMKLSLQRKLAKPQSSAFVCLPACAIKKHIVAFPAFSCAYFPHFSVTVLLQSGFYCICMSFKFPLIAETEKLNIHLLWALMLVKMNV